MRTAFEEVVDDYLGMCARLGRSPLKPYSGRPVLRIPPEIHAALAVAAEVSGKSIIQWAAETFVEAAKR